MLPGSSARTHSVCRLLRHLCSSLPYIHGHAGDFAARIDGSAKRTPALSGFARDEPRRGLARRTGRFTGPGTGRIRVG